MLANVINKIKNSRSLLNYFFLTYVDKIVSFALPLAILFLIKDKGLYTFVEVAFSYATLAMIVIELGFSNYLFFGYKKAEDKNKFVSDSQLYFKFLLLFYCLFSVFLLLGINYYDKKLLFLFVLVGIRTLFTLFISFYSNIFRLTDNPSKIYLTTIIVNVLSFILLMLANFFSWPHQIIYFFLPSFALLLSVCIKFVLFEITLFNFNGFVTFLRQSLKFSWPIILNVLAMSYINNYAKIYAYGHLSQQEMVQISFIMRIGLIVQLTHASFSSYFSKSLFMDVKQTLNMKIFKHYNLVLLFSIILVVLIILATNYLFSAQIQIPLTLSTFLFIFYIVLWCYIGYLELYFGVMNANKRILYYSLISSAVYTLLLKIFTDVNLLQLAIFMVITALLNLALVITGLHRLGVITLKRRL